jgi:hypothetical protein
VLGRTEDGEELRMNPCGTNLYLSGPPAACAAWLRAIADGLKQHLRQFCVIDSVGHYAQALEPGSDPPEQPDAEKFLRDLDDPRKNALIDLRRLTVEGQVKFTKTFLAGVRDLHERTGHPHWLIVNQAGSLLDNMFPPSELLRQGYCDSVLLMADERTSSPGESYVATADLIMCMGEHRDDRLRDLVGEAGIVFSESLAAARSPTDAWVWSRAARAPLNLRLATSSAPPG